MRAAVNARDLAPGPYRVVDDHGIIEDANGNSVLRFALRLLGDDSWREIANEFAAAHDMREALTEMLDSIDARPDIAALLGFEELNQYRAGRAALAKASGQ